MTTVSFYQLDQVATMTGLKERTLRAVCERGELPGAAKIGKAWIVHRGKLEAHLGVELPEPQRTEEA